MIKYNEGLTVFLPSQLNDNHYLAGFSTKVSGDGRKTNEVLHFFKKNNFAFDSLVKPIQIHSTNVAVIKDKPAGPWLSVEDTDGIVTKLSSVILTIITADCVPILFADKKLGVLGASHQGWRGTLKRLPQKIIKKMIQIGADIKAIKVAIGPSIGECCYDIEEERYYDFMSEFEKYEKQIFNTRRSRRHLSLSYLNYLLILESGIPKEHIDFFPFCTKCDSSRFYSYRRENRGTSGEMFSYILKN